MPNEQNFVSRRKFVEYITHPCEKDVIYKKLIVCHVIFFALFF